MTRPLRTRRLLAAVAVAPLLTTALVACGGDSDEAGDPATGSSATSEPGDATSEDAAGGPTDDLEAGQDVPPAQFVEIVGAGVEESTTARMTTISSFGGTELTGEGVVDYTTSPPSLSMAMDLPGTGGQTEVVSVDGIVYVSLGQMSNGKFWKIDPSDPDSPLAALGMEQLLQQSDPLAALQAMEPAIDEVTYVGEEDVADRALDHYELTVDLRKSLEAMGTDVPPAATKDLPETLTYDVWLDEEGRFGRMVMELPVMGSTTTTQMDVDDWGTDVSIEAPPADQVEEVPDMGQMTSPSPAA